MKMKSVSVENLGNILKQMVNTALKDSNQIAKLYRAIYEDWYFKKMTELEDATSKINNVKVNKKIEQEISYSLNSAKQTNKDNSIDALNEIKYLIKPDPDNIKIIKHDKSCSRNIPIMRESVETIIGTKYSDKTCLQVSEDEKYINNDSNVANQVVIEVCNNSITQRTKIKKKLHNNTTNQNRNQNKEKLVKQVKRRLSFESWKKEKSLIYRKSLKETEEKKLQESQKKLANTECRKASQELTFTLVARGEPSEKTNLQKQINERRIADDQAFNVWKKQRDMKQEAKLLTKNKSHQLKRSAEPLITLADRSKSQFNSWLDQLDNVLHQKYLREHRHLVRSFYCQPMYYGSTIA